MNYISLDKIISYFRRLLPRFILRFEDRSLEEDFRLTYRNQTIHQIQASIMLGMILYGLFYLLDNAILVDGGFSLLKLARDFPELFWTRIVVICLGVAIFIYSKRKNPKHLYSLCAFGGLIGGIGILWMVRSIAMYSPEYLYAYYQGILLVIIYCQIALRVFFIYSWSTGLIILALMYFWPVHKPTNIEFINSFVHAICGFGVGAYGSWWMEKYARQNYLSARAHFAVNFYAWLKDKKNQFTHEQHDFLTEAVPLIVEGMKASKKFKVSDLAEGLFLSPRALQMKCRDVIDMTPRQLIEEVIDGLALAAHTIGGEPKENIYKSFAYRHADNQKRF